MYCPQGCDDAGEEHNDAWKEATPLRCVGNLESMWHEDSYMTE